MKKSALSSNRKMPRLNRSAPLLLAVTTAIHLIACTDTSSPPNAKTAEKAASVCIKLPYEVIALEGGTTLIGSEKAYPEEAPLRRAKLSAFDIDNSEVTNAQFLEFVTATGYKTDAEKIQAGFGVPGGAVFKTPTAANPSWWQFVEGANWKHPEGPETSIKNKDNFPVVQISYNDAQAYAKWKGRRLPTETEWEYAAKGGAETLYVWGEKLVPDGRHKANTWQGGFPVENTGQDGFFMRSPAGCFQPNDYGLYDMIGNVWEWTSTQANTQSSVLTYTIKGGSFLCAPNFCQRYRASAKQPQEADFTTNHIGFRTVKTSAEKN